MSTRNSSFAIWFPAIGAMGAIVAFQLWYFGVICHRGLDLTDEGFYILNYRYWSVTPIPSAFGAYFSPVFLLSGESVAAVRWFGYLLVLLSTAALALAMVRWMIPNASSPVKWYGAAVAVALAPIFQFLIPHPLTPGYNALAYILTAITLAIAVNMLAAARESKEVPNTAFFAWGFFVSIALLNKFSTGTQILVWQGILLVYGIKVLTLARGLPRALLISAAGLVVQIGIILVLSPDIFALLRAGVEVIQSITPRDPFRELYSFVAVGTRTLLGGWRVFLLSLVLAVAYVFMSRSRRTQPIVFDRAVYIFAFATMLGAAATADPSRGPWLWAVAMVALACRQWQTQRCRVSLAIAGATIMMPFAYAFGTANSPHAHMSMALPILGVWMSSYAISLHAQRRLEMWQLILPFLLLGVLVTVIQTRGWFEKRANYRLDTEIARQVHWLPANPGHVRLRVDESLARDIEQWVLLAKSAGMPPGATAIEFTGQAPGLLALQAARPLGFLWLVGGGPFNGDAAAATALRHVSAQEVAAAWLLSSDDSDHRMHRWRELVTATVGGFPYEMAGQTMISDPTSPDPLKRITVTLWRPLSQRGAN